MKKIIIKNLVLNKQTIADLAGIEMAGVHGGGPVPPLQNSSDPQCDLPTLTDYSCEMSCDHTGKTLPESICTC